MAYVRLLQQRRAFRRLWWGDVVSLIGDWFNMIAVYVAVQSISSSAQALAAVFLAKTLPAMFVAPVAGPIVDRFDRRRILIVMDVVRATAVAVLIAAYHAGSLAGIYGALVVIAMAAGVASPAKNAALPMLVPERELSEANALEGATWSVMLAVGAALGGVATAALGVEAALWIDLASYVVSGLLFVGLPRLPPQSAEGEDRSFVAGLRYLLGDKSVLGFAALKPLMALAAGGVILIPVLGGAAPAAVGLLFMARGLGAFVGSMLPKKNVVLGFALEGAGFFILAAVDGLLFQALGLFVTAIGAGLIWVESSTKLMARADKRFHGRVFAVEFGVMTTVSAAAAWVMGAGLDFAYSPQAAAAAVGLVMLTVALSLSVARTGIAQPIPSR